MNRPYFYTIVCLLISLWIYVFYRTEDTVINRMITTIISITSLKELKLIIKAFLPLPNFVIYSLPEGLWIFATTIISGNLIMKIKSTQIHIIYLPLIMACLIEFVQYVKLSRGVFDWFDVMVIFFFWALGYVFVKKSSTSKTIKPNVIYVLFTYIIVIFSYVWK